MPVNSAVPGSVWFPGMMDSLTGHILTPSPPLPPQRVRYTGAKLRCESLKKKPVVNYFYPVFYLPIYKWEGSYGGNKLLFSQRLGLWTLHSTLVLFLLQ